MRPSGTDLAETAIAPGTTTQGEPRLPVAIVFAVLADCSLF